MKTLQQKIDKAYNSYFSKVGVSATTGQLANTDYRFATMPYIGCEYANAPKKILFVGMDMGKDEANKIQSFEERRINVESSAVGSPHIAGAYISVLYLLQDVCEGYKQHVQQVMDSKRTFQWCLKNMESLPGSVLPHVALTNYYKFVKEGNKIRSTDIGRVHSDTSLFVEEVNIFEPDVIFFQGKHLASEEVRKQILFDKRKIIIAPHPSYRKKGGRILENYIKEWECFG